MSNRDCVSRVLESKGGWAIEKKSEARNSNSADAGGASKTQAVFRVVLCPLFEVAVRRSSFDVAGGGRSQVWLGSV